jgi:hypothetical protein
LLGHIGADGVRDLLVLAPAEDLGFVQGAVGAEKDLRDPLGQVAHRLFENPQIPTPRGHVPGPELIVEDDLLLRPEHDHGLVPARPIVGYGRRVLVALHERGVHIEGGRGFAGAALEARDQREIRLAQPRQGAGLHGNRGLRASRPERAVRDVEGLQEVPHGGGRGQRVPEQGGQGLVLAERGEVLAAVPAAGPERDETLDELRGR